MKYADDFLAIAGCVLILVGVWKYFPSLIWFIGGGMCLIFSLIIAIGTGAKDDHS